MAKIMKKKNWFKNKRENKIEINKGDVKKYNARNYRKLLGEKIENRERVREDDDAEVETVLFLPSTPHGKLMKKLKETDRIFRMGTNIKRIKFVERSGTSLQDMLVSGNPWRDIKCGREKCFICRSLKGGMGACTNENALYCPVRETGET